MARDAYEREAQGVALPANYLRRGLAVQVDWLASPPLVSGPRPRVESLDDLPTWRQEFGGSLAPDNPWVHVLTIHAGDYGRRTRWIDGFWATGLPLYLVVSTWAALYLTNHVHRLTCGFPRRPLPRP